MLYRLDRVGVAFATRAVLRDVTLQHNPGEKLVLLGRNGSGKTTLLRVVAGEQETETGTVERARGFELARVEQLLAAPGDTAVLAFCLGAFPGLIETEREIESIERHGGGEGTASRLHELHERYERLDGYRARPRVEAALDAVGLGKSFLDRPIGSLSGGERTRAALVRALLSTAPLLLLDEPTNHLDLVGVDFLARELAGREGALLLVTHDRELVDRVGGEILELHGGRLERYPAGYERYRSERAARREQQRREYELQQAEVARQEEFIRRNIAGQNTRQAQSRQKLLDRMARLEAPEPDLAAVALRWPRLGRSGERVLEVEGLDAGFDTPVLRGVTLNLRRGERLAVIGRNGAGKSTLLQTLSGRLPALAGRIRLGTGVVPGTYDQDHAEVPAAVSVLQAMLGTRPDWAPADARAWAGRFGFSGEKADALTETLSGGERARLSLALLLASAPNLLILDEPTNHLDLPTCEALEEALVGFPGALVLVSHDRRLVERTATSALLIEGGGVEPLLRVQDGFTRIGVGPPPRQRDEERRPQARRSAAEEERRKLRRELARAEERVTAVLGELEASEARLKTVDELLCQPDVFSDPARCLAASDEARDLHALVAELTEGWVAAESELERVRLALAALGGE